MNIVVTGQGRIELIDADSLHLVGFCRERGLYTMLREIGDAREEDRPVELPGPVSTDEIEKLGEYLSSLSPLRTDNQELRQLGAMLRNASGEAP